MEADQNPSLFWRLTLREIGAILGGVSARQRQEHNNRAWLAWHIEALARQKRMPKLADLMQNLPKKRRGQTPEEMEAITRSWLASRQKKKT